MHLKLHLQAHWSYLCRCVKDKPQRPKFLGLQMSQTSAFRIFCWKVSSGFTSVLLYMFIGATVRDMYNMGLKSPISGPQSKSKCWVSVTFTKSFHWFHISIASHAHQRQVFLDVWRIWASEAINLNTDRFSTQYEQIPMIFWDWQFWLTLFFRSITFWWAYG